jgi:hypothetical protein
MGQHGRKVDLLTSESATVMANSLLITPNGKFRTQDLITYGSGCVTEWDEAGGLYLRLQPPSIAALQNAFAALSTVSHFTSAMCSVHTLHSTELSRLPWRGHLFVDGWRPGEFA